MASFHITTKCTSVFSIYTPRGFFSHNDQVYIGLQCLHSSWRLSHNDQVYIGLQYLHSHGVFHITTKCSIYTPRGVFHITCTSVFSIYTPRGVFSHNDQVYIGLQYLHSSWRLSHNGQMYIAGVFHITTKCTSVFSVYTPRGVFHITTKCTSVFSIYTPMASFT